MNQQQYPLHVHDLPAVIALINAQRQRSAAVGALDHTTHFAHFTHLKRQRRANVIGCIKDVDVQANQQKVSHNVVEFR